MNIVSLHEEYKKLERKLPGDVCHEFAGALGKVSFSPRSGILKIRLERCEDDYNNSIELNIYEAEQVKNILIEMLVGKENNETK